MGSIRARKDNNMLFMDFRHKGVRCREQTALMENPSKPNAKLKAALKRYQKAKRDDAGTGFSWGP